MVHSSSVYLLRKCFSLYYESWKLEAGVKMNLSNDYCVFLTFVSFISLFACLVSNDLIYNDIWLIYMLALKTTATVNVLCNVSLVYSMLKNVGQECILLMDQRRLSYYYCEDPIYEMLPVIFPISLRDLSHDNSSIELCPCTLFSYRYKSNVTWYTLNLDLPPYQRWTQVIKEKKAEVSS